MNIYGSHNNSFAANMASEADEGKEMAYSDA